MGVGPIGTAGRRLLVAAALLATGLSASASQATSLVVVSADANLWNDGGIFGPLADNQQFFANVLGAGDRVAVLAQEGIVVPPTDHDETANGFYGGLPGVTSSTLTGPLTAADLAGVDLFVSTLPERSFGTVELDALRGLLSVGGSIFLVGESPTLGFAPSNAVVNEALTALGVEIQIDPLNLDPAGAIATGAQIALDPLTAGVDSLSYLGASRLTGGIPLVRASGGQTILAYAVVAPEPSTGLLCGLGWIGFGFSRRRRPRAISPVSP